MLDNYLDLIKMMYPTMCKKYGAAEVAAYSSILDESGLESAEQAEQLWLRFPTTVEEDDAERQQDEMDDVVFKLMEPESHARTCEIAQRAIARAIALSNLP